MFRLKETLIGSDVDQRNHRIFKLFIIPNLAFEIAVGKVLLVFITIDGFHGVFLVL